MVVSPDPVNAATHFAASMRCYLLDHHVPPEIHSRMVQAAHILESGRTFGLFEAMGHLTLAELKERYVLHVVEREGEQKAASRALDIDQATTSRIVHRAQDRNGSGQIAPSSSQGRRRQSARRRKRRSHTT